MTIRRAICIAGLLLPASLTAQKQGFKSLADALQSAPILAGRGAPQNVFWLDGGTRFSFITRDPQSGRQQIRVYNPATGRDSLLFSGEGLTVPGTTNPFL